MFAVDLSSATGAPTLTHRRPRVLARLALAGLVTAAAAAGCTGGPDPAVPMGPFQLVFFDSCDDALSGLRAAAKAAVTPYGLPGVGMNGGFGGDVGVAPPMAAEDRAAGAPMEAPGPGFAAEADKQAPGYSGTNTHESGVDEPDLVKTDGRRIITIADGRLSVVDAASRRLVGVVDLGDDGLGYEPDLLLAGDHALVLVDQPMYYRDDVIVDLTTTKDAPVGRVGAADPQVEPPIAGATLILVDLTGPRILSQARVDGALVDARQVGDTVRVVTRSAPRLALPGTAAGGSEADWLAANRAAIDASGIEAWAPRIEVTTGGETQRSSVGCDQISRAANYTAANMLTVLSFDLGESRLGDGRPVSIVADGDTVYSNGISLYVASTPWMTFMPEARVLVDPPAGVAPDPAVAKAPVEGPRTAIYKFDTSGPTPRYVGGGSVPGQLINQYAMSEWAGRLRVASTIDGLVTAGGGVAPSQSQIAVLEAKGGQLTQVGVVTGLGVTERIYAVRFVGPVGYVVTFRQTDPLYTVDLRDPTAPTVRGELKIPGYSAYLHPAGDTRLIGVGQDATEGGQVLGAQVALFDVADLASPKQVAKYVVPGGYSEAEFDPHAFLYWPESGLLVVPLQTSYAMMGGGAQAPGSVEEIAPTRLAYQETSGALVLRVDGDRIVEVGFLTHPGSANNGGYPMPIRRSLIIDTTLWTVSAGGLMATDANTLTRLAWIPLS